MKQAWQLTTTRTIDLGWEQMLILEGRPGTRVKVLFGDVWLTEHGSQADHFPRAGEEITLSTFGRTVIEPLGPAWVRITEAARGSVSGGFIASLRERVRAFFAKDPDTRPESA